MIEAKSTTYQRVTFRSRLEARWAVVFDYLEMEWLYEPQRYIIDVLNGEQHDEHTYLPDFFLPATNTWVEVKGDLARVDWTLLAHAIDGFGRKLPHVHEGYHSNSAGLLLLGDIPNPWRSTPVFPLLQHYKGGYVTWATPLDSWLTRRQLHVADHDVSFESHHVAGGTQGDDWIRRVADLWRPQVGIAGVQAHVNVTRAYSHARQLRFDG
jgi:hypothetical protein